MTVKKLILSAALVSGATLAATSGMATATSAQGYYGGPDGQGYYGYAPEPAPYDNYGPAVPDCDRGGPGPRVGCGSGMGVGAER